MLFEQRLPLFRVLQIEGGRGPDPVVEFVAGANLTDPAVHDIAGHCHDRALPLVLKGDAFDAVRAKQGQLTDVLLELNVVPGVPGIGGVPVTELVTADGQGRGGGDFQPFGQGCRAFAPVQRPQQLAHAKQCPPGIGPVNPNNAGSLDGKAEPFSAGLGEIVTRPWLQQMRPIPGLRSRKNDDGDTVSRPLFGDRPVQSGSGFDLLRERPGGHLLCGRHRAGADDDHSILQIHLAGVHPLRRRAEEGRQEQDAPDTKSGQ